MISENFVSYKIGQLIPLPTQDKDLMHENSITELIGLTFTKLLYINLYEHVIDLDTSLCTRLDTNWFGH